MSDWPSEQEAIAATNTEITRLRARVEELEELLRGVGANRYWEGRWRDDKARAERAEAELAQWGKKWSDERDRADTATQSLANMTERNAKLVEALQQYADRNNWNFSYDIEDYYWSGKAPPWEKASAALQEVTADQSQPVPNAKHDDAEPE